MRVISGTARGTKINSIEQDSTRPTLDRVKESLFNIISSEIMDSRVLDLFAGSGALGIECASRGCEKVYFCDKEVNAIKMIKQNLEKTRLMPKAEIINKDYIRCLESLKNEKMDIIFIDPPYRLDVAVDSVKRIMQLDLLTKDGIIILETDDKERELEGLKNIEINVYDVRKYGRVFLLFLHRKG